MKRNLLKDFLSGLAMSVLVMTCSPRTVFPAPAAADLPRLGPPTEDTE